MGHGLADFELDMSFPCFPDVITIWGGVSKQVRQLLMMTKVGLHPTPPLTPRLPEVLAALCQQVPLLFPEPH